MSGRLVAVALMGIAALAPSRGLAGGGMPLASYSRQGDSIPAPLEGRTGDSARGRMVVLDRTSGNCLICHRVPVPSEPFQGELGPDLVGIGARMTAGQIRLRLVDSSILNPTTIMPPYYRIDHLERVADKFEGRPILDAQQIEDVVAWLDSLKVQSSGNERP